MANGKPGRPKGLPKTGGRKKGVGDKTTAALVELCQEYTPEAVKVLRSIMNNAAEKAPARVTAANIIIERGHGKPNQPVTGPDGGPVIVQVVRYANDPHP